MYQSAVCQSRMATANESIREIPLVAVPDSLEDYCPSCGQWVSYLAFDHDEGWCNACVGESGPRCTSCGGPLDASHGRTTCHACRVEAWLTAHADELEWFVVVKGYTLGQARSAVSSMIRPICQLCHRPIKGAKAGALFHKTGRCRAAYQQFKRLQRQGLSSQDALATIRRTRGR